MEIRFKLNPKNEKDQVIMDVLHGEYSPAETIKNILYKIGYSGNKRHFVESDIVKIYSHLDDASRCTSIAGILKGETVAPFDDVKSQEVKKERYADDEINIYFA